MNNSADLKELSIFDNVSIGICIIDCDYKVLFWNTHLEDWTKINKQDIIGSSLFDFYPNFNKFIYRSRIDAIFDGGPPVVFSPQLHKKLYFPVDLAGKTKFFYITVNSGPSIDEKTKTALFSIKDITELEMRVRKYKIMHNQALKEVEQRRAAERNLMKSERQLKELNATKDKFFSIIAHDLKNPISGFRDLTAFLSSNYDELSESEKLEWINITKQSAEVVFSLLNDLLDWSRSQRGLICFNQAEIDLYWIAENVISILQGNAQKKNIRLENKILPNTIAYVDVSMILAVLRNLLSNAIKFTPNGGKCYIDFELLPEENLIRIHVVDNGVGIDPGKIDALFKIDSSFTTPGTDNERGTGLGLILCKEFINKHNGNIWVESELGEGSKFIFTVPSFLR